MAKKKKRKRRQSPGTAWHWKQTGCWYYTEPGTKRRVSLYDENGERIRGLENREAANDAMARVRLARDLTPPKPGESGRWTVARVCDLYLEDLHQTATKAWAKQVEGWLNDLCEYCGALRVDEFKKMHLRKWLARHDTWNHNTQRNVISAVIAAFNFCIRFDELAVNPVAGYKKPAGTVRVTAFSPEEEKKIYKNTDKQFGLFFKACILTGARPYSELAKVTADHVVETEHGMCYVLKAREADGRGGHKTGKKTGQDRRIMLCDEMEEITLELMKTAPKGSGKTLFRSPRGKAWSKVNCTARFCKLRKELELPADRCMYSCRHTFAKRILSGYYTGQPTTIEVLAGLMGNSPKVCWQHYAQWSDQYIDPLWAALGKGRKKRAA